MHPASPKVSVDLGNVSGAVTIDASSANTWQMTLAGDVTITVANPRPGESLSVYAVQDGTGGRAITWAGATIQSSDTSLLAPIPGAGAESSFFFMGVSGAVMRLVGATSLGGGQNAYQVNVPAVLGTHSGAQNVSVKQGNAFEASLTGDSAITWTSLPSADVPAHSQSWWLYYNPGSHHATFPNTNIPAATLAAIAAAETAGTFAIIMEFFCASDGRILLSSWAAAS